MMYRHCSVRCNFIRVFLYGIAASVPRPVRHVRGLAVTKAIGDSLGPQGAFVTTVEAFLYPGDGQVIVTALGVSRTVPIAVMPSSIVI